LRRWITSGCAGLLIAAAMLVGGGGVSQAAACTLSPVLLDTTINQGLQSYSQLVRGKETLVRFYFGLPSCATAGNAIQVNAAQLTVRNQSAGGAVLVSNAATLAPIGSTTPPLITSTAKQIDATSDPKWVVSLVGPTTSSFNASFEATLRYQTKTCATCALSTEVSSPPFSVAPGTRSTLITKTVAARTNALRLLVVPMLTPPGVLADADRQNLQNALTVLSRGGPFSDAGGRLGDLGGGASNAGIRYTINAGFIDLTPLLSGGQFCGSNSNFGAIDASLASILQSFNSLNPTSPADKVVGVVPGSLAVPSAANPACFEGESSPGGIDSWVRLGNLTGAVFMQELAHNWGIEPFARSNGAYHSIYTTAHAAAGDPGKTYNVLERAYVRSDGSSATVNVDRTALISNINNGVTNSAVLLENADWNDAFCFLGGPVPTLAGSACTGTRTVSGTAVGVAASAPGPAMQITAHTNGTVTGTAVVSSFVDNQLLTGQDPSSNYHIVGRNSSNGITIDFRAPASPLEGHTHIGVEVDEGTVLISSTVSRPAGTTKMELWKGAPGAAGSVKLATSADDGHPPAIQSSDATSNALSIAPGGSRPAGGGSFSTDPIPPKVDIFLLQDETSSFGGQIAAMQALTGASGSLITELNGTGSNYATGVAGFRDFARDGWGGPGDWVYHRYANIQAGGAGFTAGTPSLSAAGGNDLPEGYLEALHYLATPGHAAIDSDGNSETSADDTPTGQQPTWRSGAKRVVLLATDDACHVTGDAGGWPGDSGTTSADTTAGILRDANITVVGLTPQGAGDGEIQCVKTLAAQSATGGTVQKTSANAAELRAAIMAGLGNLPVTVALSATCDKTGFTLAVDPASQSVTSGDLAHFSVTMSVAANVTPGLYSVSCPISRTVDGVVGTPIAANFTIAVTNLEGDHTVVTWTASDDSSGPLHGDVAMKCGELFHILAANVASDAQGRFTYDTPVGCPGGTIYVSVNDGWNLTPPQQVDPVDVNNTAEPPVVEISSPTTSSRVLQFSDIALAGGGKFSDGTPITGSALVWKLDGAVVGSGETVDVPPPSGGWPLIPAAHTVRLEGPSGAFADTQITILGDADNDGVATPEEPGLNACRPGGAVTNPDNYPYNATEDNDGDGIPNASDAAPCTRENDFEASTLMVPTRFNVNAPSSLTFNGIFNPFFDMTAIPQSKVRITKVGGIAVSGSQWNATGWAVSRRFDGTIAVAAFSGSALASFLNAHPTMIGHSVLVTVAGTTSDGSKSFHADGQTSVYKG
jgi:hypothetical protein